MWIPTEMDFAFKEDRLRREKEQKKQEKIKKLEILIIDPAATEGEKRNAKMILNKLKNKW